MRLYPSVKWACTELTYEREDTEEEVEVETDEAVATLKALQEYQSKKKDRKNRPPNQDVHETLQVKFVVNHFLQNLEAQY